MIEKARFGGPEGFIEFSNISKAEILVVSPPPLLVVGFEKFDLTANMLCDYLSVITEYIQYF